MKGKTKEMKEYINKLRACVKWLLEREDATAAETMKTCGLLESSEKRHSELVAGIDQLENSITEIKSKHEELQQRLKTLEAEKMDALRILEDEKEARVAVEKRLNDQIKMLEDTNRSLQEYNTSLQQYNCNLQADTAKNSMVETMNDLLKKVESLRMELQHAREDRDSKSAQGTHSYHRERLRTLEIKLAAADAKLKLSDSMASETMSKLENQLESALSRLQEAEQQILDGEKLRKKLHNAILELKGNIRVFCRVRPLLSNESGAVSYPKIGENVERGIELMHNAQAYSFTFDKVFDHLASQQDVFIEISQLIQSALDGYKVAADTAPGLPLPTTTISGVQAPKIWYHQSLEMSGDPPPASTTPHAATNSAPVAAAVIASSA
ncbi:hypothetical protein U9M48_011278 [Paspalum notatum var. saurae]|uniref:Kinesin motor domain-containing protein n=1 Tax=Paspalum notatum var. saurae TaxID=547442 RepID=A0AAQ3SV10_PASNO